MTNLKLADDARVELPELRTEVATLREWEKVVRAAIEYQDTGFDDALNDALDALSLEHRPERVDK